ncbi:hypothetical protein ACFFU9_06425 [Mariniflexile ostreae]|uniref:DUF4129 domain-containing protein n=1 Tax=Mariniflexile ostreae TaxID=1520892 RepID=A0ABV5FAC0_9FLAO
MLNKRLVYICWILCFFFQNHIGFAVSHTQHPQYNNQFDTDFKTRYSGSKYDYNGQDIIGHTASGSGEIADYKNQKNKTKVKNNEDVLSMNLGALDWLFIIALIGAVGYLAFLLLNEGGSGLFSRRQHQKLNKSGEITAENIENTNIQSLINIAENDKDYRLAIRYHYLLVLKTLSLKKLIKFEDDKTNADYLNELSHQPFVEKFSYTLYLYNYTWYGEFDVDNHQYNTAKTNFTNLLNAIS